MEYTDDEAEKIAFIAGRYAALVQTMNMLNQIKGKKINSHTEFEWANKFVDIIVPIYNQDVPEKIKNLLPIKISDLEAILKQIHDNVPK